MPQVVQLGQLNTAALQVADVYVQIVPPQFLINGIPTNVVGIVGSASWGQVGAAVIVGGYADYASKFGQMVPRKYDMGTHVWTSYLQGGQAVYRCVRVTDGSDVAASVTVQTNCLTLTSKYTGSLGNSQTAVLAAGSQANSWKITLNLPGRIAEVFDNITQGIQSIAVTAGTGYTSVPAVTATAAPSGGVNAQVNAALKLLAAPTIAVGGNGYVVSDTITLPNGVVLTVATLSGSAVATVTLTNPGSLTAGNVPTNPVAQSSTSGVGTGATFTLGAWGLGTPTIVNPGQGYTVAPTLTVVGGGGSGGALVATLAYWPNVAAAINLGQTGLRGPSQIMVATNGTGTATPIAATLTLAGGTDGAGAVNGTTLLGSDVLPRKGLYALRGTGASVIMLSDCDDSTTWSTQVAYGLGEGAYMIACGPSSDSISNAATVKATAGIDSYALKLMLGDWIYMLDTVNNQTRLVSPQGYVAGLLGNLAPNQSTLNKQMQGIVGTQKSYTGVPYTTADLQALAQAGIDVICNPIPAGNMFGCRNGRNTSSNAVIHGDNYTRMTNFLAFTIAGGMGIYVGTLQTKDQRRRAKTTLDSFLSNLQQQGLIGNASGTDAFQVVLDDTNNPFNRVALGYEQADVKVTYLSVVEFLIINLEGGQSVQIQRTTQPAVGQ
jgi:hypothetical protein